MQGAIHLSVQSFNSYNFSFSLLIMGAVEEKEQKREREGVCVGEGGW